MTGVAVGVHDLRVAYGRRAVLEGVSFEVPAGKTFALLGRNGAGKTTLIRTLLGLPPAAGGVRVLGLDPARDPLAVRRRVGYLAEDQVMYPWMTPAELCGFLRPFYPTWDDRLAGEYLDRFELPQHARIGRLSKGQSVKLGLTVALAHRPELAVLDDPALGLDPIARKEFSRDLVEHLQAAGRTVVYSSHLLGEVEAVADIVAILDRGRVVRLAETDVLRDAVRQVVLPAAAAADLPPPPTLLDARRRGDRLAVVLDGAAEFIERLERDGVEYEAASLSLDDIFEAFVIGRPQGWPGAGERVAAGS
jgi:ABC-2 type transport system ATP-binding protein